MEVKQSNLAEVTVQLLTSGKYKWTIVVDFEKQDQEGALGQVKSIDEKLKQMFPQHPEPGSGRVSSIEDD